MARVYDIPRELEPAFKTRQEILINFFFHSHWFRNQLEMWKWNPIQVTVAQIAVAQNLTRLAVYNILSNEIFGLQIFSPL